MVEETRDTIRRDLIDANRRIREGMAGNGVKKMVTIVLFIFVVLKCK